MRPNVRLSYGSCLLPLSVDNLLPPATLLAYLRLAQVGRYETLQLLQWHSVPPPWTRLQISETYPLQLTCLSCLSALIGRFAGTGGEGREVGSVGSQASVALQSEALSLLTS